MNNDLYKEKCQFDNIKFYDIESDHEIKHIFLMSQLVEVFSYTI